MPRSSATLLAAVFLVTTIAQSALAEAAPPPLKIGSRAVSYQDLDLTKAADAQKLLGRLERAAVSACGGNPKLHPSYALMPRHTTEVFQECRRSAVAAAVAKVGAPALSQAFASAYGEAGCNRIV